MDKKRGLSPVVATVLIVLLTVVSVSILSAFVIPFVRDNLEGSGQCFEVVGKLEIYETPYNCYASSSGKEGTGFSISVDDEKIIGFRVSLVQGGSFDSYEIKGGATLNNIRMLGSNFSQPLQIPSNGGVRTYIADGDFDKIEVFALLDSGDSCDLSDSLNVKPCITQDSEVIGNLTQY